MNEKRVPGRRVFIAIEIVCVILLACLVGATSLYQSQINDKDYTLTNLQNQVTIQQKALNDLLNGTTTLVTVDDIALNASAWLNKAVIVGGKLSGPLNFSVPVGRPPYNYTLFRFNETSEASMVFAGLSWNSSDLYDLVNVAITGVVSYRSTGFGLQGSGFFIKTESVILLK
jgi:hypothetical protein